ncbi:MAG TPA: signal peptidase I [Treponemataceae bacterium]|nr:signal peptidase I [Treponemataceae bacterium]
MAKNQYDYAYMRRKKNQKSFLRLLISIFAIFLLVQIGFSFLIKPFYVTTSAMIPQLENGNAVFVLPKAENRPGFFNTKSVNRGDVVILNVEKSYDDNWFINVYQSLCAFFTFQKSIPENSRNKVISDEGIYRVVGMPGDSIYMNNYILYIRQPGESHYLTEYEIVQKDYNLNISQIPENWHKDIGVPGNTDIMTLASDDYFLLCDNRVSSMDSRLFGPIKSKRIGGIVFCRYYPFKTSRLL